MEMFYFKIIILTVFMTSVYGHRQENSAAVNCSIHSRCSRVEDIVYATDKVNCFVYRNPCLYGIAECERRLENKCAPKLKVVTKEECKKYCKNFCTADFRPVCGEYNDTMKTFGNKCMFLSESCQNDKSYIFVQDGECPQPAVI